MTSNNNSLGQNNSYKSEKTFVCSVNTSLHNKNRKPSAEGFDKQEVTIDGLINVIQKGEGWSCSVFKNNYRSQENFLHAQAVGIDIDKGMTLNEAFSHPFVKQYAQFIYTSASHQKQNNDGLTCDRFRIVFLAFRAIDDLATYRALVAHVMRQFTTPDEKCKDGARAWYGNTEAEIFHFNGELIPDSFIAEARNEALARDEKAWAKREKREKYDIEQLETCVDEETLQALSLEALRYIPPIGEAGSGTYERTFDVGCAIASIFSHDWERIIDRWCPVIPNRWDYQGLDKYASSYSAGTIFYYASKFGWSFPKNTARGQDAKLTVFHNPNFIKLTDEGFASIKPGDNLRVDFDANHRRRVWLEPRKRGYRFLIDTSFCGSGKTHIVPELQPSDFGKDIKQIIYLHHRYKNPVVTELEKFTILYPRHNGMVTDKNTGLWRHIKKNEIPEMTPNCHWFEKFTVASSIGIDSDMTKDLICCKCPFDSKCKKEEGDDFGYRYQRSRALKTVRIRADINSLPPASDYPYENIVLVVDEIGNIPFVKSQTVKITSFIGELRVLNHKVGNHLSGFLDSLERLAGTAVGQHGEILDLNALSVPSEIDTLIQEINEVLNQSLSIDDLVVEKQLNLIPEKEPIDYKPLIVVKTILSVILGREQGSILRTKCDLTIKTKNNHHIDILNRAGYVIGLDATPIWQVLNSVIEQPILEVREEALPLSNLTIRSTITKGLKHSLNLTNKNSLAPRRVDAIIHKRANYDPKIIGFQRLGDLYYWFNHNRACNDLAKSAYLIVKGCPNPNVNNVKADYLTLFGNDDGFDTYYRALRDAEVIQVLGRQRSQNFTENTFTLEFLHEELPLGRIAHQYGCNFEEKNAFEVCTDAGEAWQITRWGIVKAILNLAFKNEKVSHRTIANLIKKPKSTVADHLSDEVIKKKLEESAKTFAISGIEAFLACPEIPIVIYKEKSDNVISILKWLESSPRASSTRLKTLKTAVILITLGEPLTQRRIADIVKISQPALVKNLKNYPGDWSKFCEDVKTIATDDLLLQVLVPILPPTIKDWLGILHDNAPVFAEEGILYSTTALTKEQLSNRIFELGAPFDPQDAELLAEALDIPTEGDLFRTHFMNLVEYLEVEKKALSNPQNQLKQKGYVKICNQIFKPKLFSLYDSAKLLLGTQEKALANDNDKVIFHNFAQKFLGSQKDYENNICPHNKLEDTTNNLAQQLSECTSFEDFEKVCENHHDAVINSAFDQLSEHQQERLLNICQRADKPTI